MTLNFSTFCLRLLKAGIFRLVPPNPVLGMKYRQGQSTSMDTYILIWINDTRESLTTIYKVRNPVTDGIPIWNCVVACLLGTVFLKQLELLWRCLLCLSGGTWACGLQLSYTSSPSLLHFPHVVWFGHMLHLELGHENLAHSCSVTCWGRHMTQVGPIRVKAYFKCYRKRSACFFLALLGKF